MRIAQSVSIYLAGFASFLSAIGFSVALEHEKDGLFENEDLVQAGRQVYISEGCIHCHSQFVRPVGGDTELWGTPTSIEQALSQRPVLIGNRRQGPDLATVGERRSPEWNRLHLLNPRELSPGSRMPAYPHLFEGNGYRGKALLAYLDQLRPTVKDL